MRAAALALVLLALVGCGSVPRKLEVSGVALKAAGQQFRAVAGAYVHGCDVTVPPTLSWEACDRFRAFGERFQVGFPLAVDLWAIAKDANDRASEQGAAAAIGRLVAELGLFSADVLAVYTGGK